MAALDLLRSLWSTITGRSSSGPIPPAKVGPPSTRQSTPGKAGPASAPKSALPKTPASSTTNSTSSSTSSSTSKKASKQTGPKAQSKAQPKAPPTPPGAFDGFAEDLKESIDFEMDMAIDSPAPESVAAPSQAGPVVEDGGPQALFASIAANYAQPIKDFIFELRRGTATNDWIEICMPVLGSVIHGAESLELHDVLRRMIEFRDALAEAESHEGRAFDTESRKRILQCFEAMAATMPATFDGEADDRRRESIIVHSLLRQIPKVGHVTLDKMYGAGLTSLDVLFLARPEDMEATTGIPLPLCKMICDKIQSHKQQLDGSKPEEARRAHRERLVKLVHDLRLHHAKQQRFVDESDVSTEAGKAKRECLRLRQACILQIDVLLAEMDEVELVEELRTLAVERRIERLVTYLGPAAAQTAVADDDSQSAINDSKGIR